MAISVSLDKAPNIFTRMAAQMPEAIRLGLLSASARMVPIMVRATDEARPASPRGTRGAVNTGAFRQRWKATVETRGTSQGVLVANDAPYAGVIEYGRRPGAKQPPSEPLARYAQRKLGLPYAQAKSVGFLMARAIKQRGLKPRYVLTSTGTKVQLYKALYGEVLHEVIALWRRS